MELTWNYESQEESVRHMGPMAEDFYDEFGLGADRERIANVDADGVALVAIQGLADRVAEKDARIDEQAETIERQSETIAEQEAPIDDLEERVAAIERDALETPAGN